MLLLSVECSTPTFYKTEPSGGDKASFRLGYQQKLVAFERNKTCATNFFISGIPKGTEEPEPKKININPHH